MLTLKFCQHPKKSDLQLAQIGGHLFTSFVIFDFIVYLFI